MTEKMMEEYEEKVLGITKEDRNNWANWQKIEDDGKCKKCNKKRLVHCNPSSPEFICSNCGHLNLF
jgi:hypothetical protein